MLEETTSTDVTTGTPSGGAEDSAAPSSVGATENTSQATAPGGVTAQPTTQGEQSTQQGAAAPPPSGEDPLKDIPTVDELRAQAEQKVPYAQGLLQLRTALEALKGEHDPLKSRFEPWQTVVEKYGDPARATTRLELADSLFGVDPETQSPTTLPFLQLVGEKSPATQMQLVRDVLALSTEDGRPLLEKVVSAMGYVPKGANVAPSADVDPEDLQKIPAEYHDAFKSFTPEERQDILLADERARASYLSDRQEKLENRKWREEQTRQAEETKRTDAQRAQEAFTQAVTQRVDGVRSEEVKAAHDQLASRWHPTGDPGQDEILYGYVMAPMLLALDPAFRSVQGEWFKAAGVELPPNYGDLVSSIEAKAADVERHERAGEKFLADEAKADLTAARERVRAYNDLAMKALMKHLDQRIQTLSRADEEAVLGAREPRTVLTGGQSPTAARGNLPVAVPAGIRPGTPEYGEYTRQRLFG